MPRRLLPLAALGALLFAACSVGEIRFDLPSSASSTGAGGARGASASSASSGGPESSSASLGASTSVSSTAVSSSGTTSSSSVSSTAVSSSGATSSTSVSSTAVSSSSASSSSGGAVCGKDNDCATNQCVGGVCCDQACTGPCMACNIQPYWVGTCVAVYPGDPGGCPAGQGCNAAQTCVPGLLNLAMCTQNAECISAHCAGVGKCKTWGQAGDICTSALQCESAVCDATTHLCN